MSFPFFRTYTEPNNQPIKKINLENNIKDDISTIILKKETVL